MADSRCRHRQSSRVVPTVRQLVLAGQQHAPAFSSTTRQVTTSSDRTKAAYDQLYSPQGAKRRKMDLAVLTAAGTNTYPETLTLVGRGTCLPTAWTHQRSF